MGTAMRCSVLIAAVLLLALPACEAGESSGGGSSGGRSGMRYANILAAQHFNDTGSVECRTGEDTTPPNVEASDPVAGAGTDCDRTASPAPAEGLQYLYLPGVSVSGSSVVFREIFTPVTTGVVVFEDNFQVIVDGETGEDGAVMAFTSHDHSTFPYVWLDPTVDAFVMQCGAGVYYDTSEDDAYEVGTWHERRLVWYETGGPGPCANLDPDCAACGCLFIDGAQVLECDRIAASVGIDGVGFTSADGEFDTGVDRWALCNEVPVEDTRCGDSPTFP